MSDYPRAGANVVASMPLVSICVPTFNRRAQLAQTLETLRRQTISDYEIIVCDDNSSDGTYEFLQSLRWSNLRVLRNDVNLNHCGSLSRLFAAARGEYVGMQHDHDLYEPNFLEKLLNILERHPTAGFACCAYNSLNGKNQLITNPSIAEFRLFPESGLLEGSSLLEVLACRTSTPIPAMGTLFRREIVARVGGYSGEWYLASDEDLYRRVAAISDVAFTREALFTMRTRPAERNSILGGRRAIYTLHEFRVDTTKKYLKAGNAKKQLNIIRLRVLRFRSLLRQCISLCARGLTQELEAITDLSNIPHLPTQPKLSKLEKASLRFWIRLLKSARWIAMTVSKGRFPGDPYRLPR